MVKELVVYSSNHCIFCTKLKEWLKENKIPYTNKDIDIPEIREEFKQFNVPGIPFSLITDKSTGETLKIVGFRPEKFKQIFNL
jgi:glutaredoxin